MTSPKVEVTKTFQEMRNIELFMALTLGAFALTSCDEDLKCVHGSGDYETRTYEVESFDELSFYGDGQVIVTHDSVRSVRVEAQGNVLDALQLDVWNGELTIGRDNCFRNSKEIKVYISTPDLDAVSLSGSGSIVGRGTFSGREFRAEISGSGEISFDLDVEQLSCVNSGSGEMVFGGWAESQYLEISGSGDIRNFDLQSREATIRISGSGNCEVSVSDRLDIRISGSGDVHYKGSPAINSRINGSGRIVHRG